MLHVCLALADMTNLSFGWIKTVSYSCCHTICLIIGSMAIRINIKPDSNNVMARCTIMNRQFKTYDQW